MRDKHEATTFLEYLHNMPLIGFDGVTYGEHLQNCLSGCSLCNDLRDLERAYKEFNKSDEFLNETAGLTLDQMTSYRRSFQRTIIDFYPNVSDALDRNGMITLAAYNVLHENGITDEDIENYFHIRHNRYTTFKKVHKLRKDDKTPEEKDLNEYKVAYDEIAWLHSSRAK